MTNIDSIPLIIGGSISLALSVFLLINKKDKKALLFALFCLGLSIHGIFGFFTSVTLNPSIALFLNKVSFIGLIICLPVFVHFSFEYRELGKYKTIINLFYLISAIFIVMSLGNLIFSDIKKIEGGFSGVPGRAFLLVTIFVLVSYSLIIYNFIKSLGETKKSEELNRIKYLIVLLSLLAFLGILDILRKSGLLVITDILLTEYGIILFVIGTAYIIEKYHLLEIKYVFHKGTMYSIIGSSVLIVFELLKSLVGEILEVFLIHDNVTIAQVSILCLTFLFEPIRAKTEKFCDKVFLKK